jgi:glycosyltransferase involved in cell wall biosynthesis
VTQCVSVVILTYNESLHLERAINSVRCFAKSVHVVDSYSSDDTLAIAKALGAEVLQHPFKHQADQFQWAMENLNLTTEWVLRLDADEIIEPDLAQRILVEMPHMPEDVTGINFDRKHIFMGRFVKYGGRYPLRMLRLFRRGFGRIEQRWMDEHIVVTSGRTVVFKGGFADHNLHDLTFFTEKHNKYATREAIDVLCHRYKLTPSEDLIKGHSSSGATALKRLLKEKIYNRMPFTLSCLLLFLYRYIIQFGFLDGREGLVYHFLQGYWYRFLVGAKVMEWSKILERYPDKASRLKALGQLSGQTISDR